MMINLSQLNNLFVILWGIIGIAAGYFYMWLIRRNAQAIHPKSQSGDVGRLLGGQIIRLIGMAVIILLAVRMNAFYGVIFVLVFTVTHFILVIRMAREEKKHESTTEIQEHNE